MPRRDIVVIGASSGGIEALRKLIGEIRSHFPGSIFVVFHTGPDSPNVLQDILSREGPLPAVYPSDKEKIRAGTIYIAPTA